MNQASSNITKKYWISLAFLSALYLILPFFVPVAAETVKRFPELAHNTGLLRLVQVSVEVPSLLIWVAAVYGISKFKAYAYTIRDSKDGEGLDGVANGLTLLIYGGIIVNLLTQLYSIFVTASPSPARTITTNYVTLAYTLAAFYLVLQGSKILVGMVKGKEEAKKSVMQATLPLAAFSALYVWLTLLNDYREKTPDPSRYPSFYLPTPLILTTLVLPYIILWFMGVMAAINIMTYRKLTKGIIYKQALSRLSLGVFLVIVFSILMQLLGTVSGSVFGSRGLASLLGIIFIILIAYAICFLVIASGARKLQQIEQVQ